MRIYDLDKSYEFKGLLVIETNGPLFLYGQSSLDQQFQSSHEFLGRLRKVRFDGHIAKEKDLVTIPIPAESKIAIDENGKVYVLFSNGSTYVFDNNCDESMIRSNFPVEFLGEYNTVTSINIDDFNRYMDTFKVDKPKPAAPKKTRATRLDVLQELLEDNDDDESLRFD
jgi:hypothetical protein